MLSHKQTPKLVAPARQLHHYRICALKPLSMLGPCFPTTENLPVSTERCRSVSHFARSLWSLSLCLSLSHTHTSTQAHTSTHARARAHTLSLSLELARNPSPQRPSAPPRQHVRPASPHMLQCIGARTCCLLPLSLARPCSHVLTPLRIVCGKPKTCSEGEGNNENNNNNNNNNNDNNGGNGEQECVQLFGRASGATSHAQSFVYTHASANNPMRSADNPMRSAAWVQGACHAQCFLAAGSLA